MPRRKEDESLVVTFEVRAVRNKARSDGEVILTTDNAVAYEIKGSGKDEIDRIPYITIEIPGDKDCVATRPVSFCHADKEGDIIARLAVLNDPANWRKPCRAPTDSRGKPRIEECDVHRFIDDWRAFAEGSGALSGRPLKEWPEVDASTVAELAYNKVHTVEQLAALNDSNASKFFGLRETARKFLAEQNDKDKQIAALAAKVAALEAKAQPQPKGKAA